MYRILTVACAVILMAGASLAAVVNLPNETQSTTFTATVSEQANVSVPASVAFNVTNVSADTNSADQSVSATTVVLSDGKALRVEIQADAANFTAPFGGTVTWAAGDISWDAATWTNGTGSANALSTSYTTVATSNANAASLSASDLTFTLADKNTVDRAGDHTLAATWKFSSVTP